MVNKRKINRFKFIAWTLVFALFVSIITPLQGSVAVAEKNSEPIKNIKELKELDDLRTENSKTYLDTKTREYVLEEYTEPVHFEEDEKWENINNDIVSEKAELDDTDLSLGNKANKYKVKFSKKSKENRTIRLKMKDKLLEFGLVGANKVKGVAEKNRMTYPGVLSNADLIFYVDNNAIKEELVFSSTPEKNEFTYEFNMKNLQQKGDE